MKITVKEKEKIIEATCDICGADCMKELFASQDGDQDDNDIFKQFSGMELKAVWGYESNKDGEIWEAIVCEDCVDKHLTKIITFLKRTYM